tara:strand:- start:609 stop:1574 length:966 start_codon:yes stop_codon:yes gene_type:complete
MKKIFTLSILTLALLCEIGAQESHLIIFSEDLNPFYAYLNGVKQNIEPQTNVKVTGLALQSYRLKVVHADETIPSLDKNIYFEPMGMANTIKITETKKGFKLRFFGQVPLSQSPVEYTEIPYHESAYEEVSSIAADVPEPPVIEDTQMNISLNVSTEMPTGANTSAESVNMNVNIDGINVGMDMNIIDAASNQTHGNMDVNMNVNEIITNINEAPLAAEPVSLGGCVSPVQDIKSIMAAIDDENFDEGKMIIAKQATSKKCLMVDQIKQIMDEFSFSENKLDFAKYGYKRCYNLDDYYQVNAAFDFSSDKEKLNDYINDQN